MQWIQRAVRIMECSVEAAGRAFGEVALATLPLESSLSMMSLVS
jgi:hypothetical protein